MCSVAAVEVCTIHTEDLCRRPHLFGVSLRYRIIAGGNPALSVCSGCAADSTPSSLLIVGLFGDATVLRAGDVCEKAIPWRDRHVRMLQCRMHETKANSPPTRRCA